MFEINFHHESNRYNKPPDSCLFAYNTSQPVESKDIIRVNDLLLTVLLRHGARWAQSNAEPVLQPILVTLSIAHDLRRTALTDDLSYSINYASICSTLCQRVTSNDVTESLEALSKRIFDLVFGLEDQSVIQEVHLKVLQIKAPLHCKTIGVDSIAKVGNGHAWGVDSVRHFCEDIECQAIVGLNACEREVKQVVRLDISIENPTGDLERSNWLDFPVLIRRLYTVSSYHLNFTLHSWYLRA